MIRMWRGPLLGLALGLVVSLLLTALAGENPITVFKVLVESSFGSRYNLGMTLFYSTPLILTGLSVSLAAQAGLFNVGAEGQLVMGSLACAAVGAVFPDLAFPWGALLATFAAVLVGGFWGFIPGWLKVVRGSHEVINTIMLNFVAAGLASYAVLYLLADPESRTPQTAHLSPGYVFHPVDPLSRFFQDTPMSSAFLLALLCAAALWIFLWRTVWGFKLRAVAENPEAALASGIRSARVQMWALTGAGSLAGLVAVAEILGSAGRYRLNFSPGYGFTGIAVALLARNSPLGVILTGLLFGALHNGTASLDLETEKITRDFSMILQGLIILFVSAHGMWRWLDRKGAPSRD